MCCFWWRRQFGWRERFESTKEIVWFGGFTHREKEKRKEFAEILHRFSRGSLVDSGSRVTVRDTVAVEDRRMARAGSQRRLMKVKKRFWWRVVRSWWSAVAIEKRVVSAGNVVRARIGEKENEN